VWVVQFCLDGQLGPIRPQCLDMNRERRLHRLSS
jgi:hypothetical protein